MLLAPTGGGTNSPSDPLAGLELPPGDPGALRSVAARLQAAATAAASSASRQSAAASSTIGTSWLGQAATSAGRAVTAMTWSAQTFTAAAGDAASALLAGAGGWERAQQEWRQAQSVAASAVADEQSHRNQAAAAATSEAAAGGFVAELGAAVTVAMGDIYLSPDRARARAIAVQAIDDFTTATNTAVGKLAGLPGPPSAAGVLEDLKIVASISDISSPAVFAATRKALLGLLRDPSQISAGDIKHLDGVLAGLTPAQRGQLVDDLAGNQVFTNLHQALSAEHPLSTWDQLFGGGDAPLARADLLRLQTLLLANADPAAVAEIVKQFPGIQPSLSAALLKQGDSYGDPKGLIPGLGPISANDVVQGNVGDCYFVSALISVAQAKAGFVASHIHDNLNGTTTVTLYQNGQPVQVTVTDSVPSDGQPQGAAGLLGDWPDLYEKAYAQLRNGYGTIDPGGTGSRGLSAITGLPTTDANPSDVSASQLAGLVHSGHSVVVSTGSTANHDDTVGSDQRSGVLIGGHQYEVQNVTGDTVTLRNPWSPGDVVTKSWSDFQSQQQINGITWTNGAP